MPSFPKEVNFDNKFLIFNAIRKYYCDPKDWNELVDQISEGYARKHRLRTKYFIRDGVNLRDDMLAKRVEKASPQFMSDSIKDYLSPTHPD